ncbi:HAMP domain-containing histidine kinase [Treponema sp. OMZ 787]|uniref:sensor histidine kinase n=1 Tax=Treponema sp. OMZ 787 TaxID=2563669 RepID=UPI0020A54FB4|nr:HAMP domain-containing sensor histidine kinase [Treponema sp. OMZ 787]UTC63042.1 HAMP domain-containing histidine kinase [Treponema sp. OMZ 787]
MNSIFFIIGIIFFTISIFIVVLNKYKVKKILSSISSMIDKAISGSFTEEHFNETKLSQIENKLAQYLLLSQRVSKNLTYEKEKIKVLITDISHQTKAPTSNIILYLELLQEEKLSESSSQYLHFIKSQTQKLNFLLESLIKISRLETGMISLNSKKRDIMPMIKRLVVEYSKTAETKGLKITLEENKSDATFDEKWTEEAIGNIIDNAIKYTEHGSIKIRIKDYEFFSCIEIEDTGIGISENDQPKIFSRFYRTEQSGIKEGIGVGLYLSRQILQQQGGYIKVSSTLNCGSVFSVFVPK